jgi:alpha-glucoside transport system substrate-binding protein
VSSRRAFLVGGVAGVAGVAGVLGCTPTADVLGLRSTVKLAVSWSGVELRAFRKVLDRVVPPDYTVDIIPMGDDIAAAFGPRAIRRPDIVMLPSPGFIETWLADLVPVPAPPQWPYAEVWNELLIHNGSVYGIPFKFAHKSAIWYRKSLIPEPPRRWDDWLTLNESLVADGVAPLALAAADGWVLTDFFENVLLGLDPSVYEQLARAARPELSRQPAVKQSLQRLGELWSMPGTLAGGADRSLVQQFPDAAVETFGYRRAAMVAAPDFAEQIVRRFAADPDDIGVFTFPTLTRTPVVAGGDVAVLQRPASTEARDLVRRLAAPEAARPWIEDGGFLSPSGSDGYSPELTRLARQLGDGSATIEFDLSDRLGPLGGSTGLQRVLQEFLARVGNRGTGSVDIAVDAALDELRRLER